MDRTQKAAWAAYMRQYRQDHLEQVRQSEREKYARNREDPQWVAAERKRAKEIRKRRLADPSNPCKVDGCDRPVRTLGLCEMHYLRLIRKGKVGPAAPLQIHGSPSERFWPKVDKNGPNGCWLWIAARTSLGYGVFGIARGNRVLAYRFAYEELVGPIPDGLELDHLCRNPPCVNPTHLEPVTHAENMRRALRSHCAQGHEWTPENTMRRSDGSRVCRACNRERSAAAYLRRKARTM